MPELLKMGVLAKVDRAAIACYCIHFERHVKAESLIRKTGLWVKTPQGKLPNPAIRISNEASKLMAKFITEFGMTASSRSRIRVEKEAPIRDSHEEFVKNKPVPHLKMVGGDGA